jgi:hypothetical protein
MKKTYDCVEMKRQIQEKLWIEGGETIEGLKKLLVEKTKNNKHWLELLERKEKETLININ